jgi:pentose-5-phosphate-3-epimerase
MRIAPSLAASSQLNLKLTIEELEKAGADIIHFDIFCL